MKGFLREALLAAAMTAATPAASAMASDLSETSDTHVALEKMGYSAGEPSATFSLMKDGQPQEMYEPAQGIYSGTFYNSIAVSCDSLTRNFDSAVKFIDDRLQPTGFEIDHQAIRPSLIKAAEKAREQCSPAMM